MKVNVFLTIVSVLLALTIGYLAYHIAIDDDNSVICGFGSSLCFIATLIPVIGLQYTSGRLGINVRVFSALFFVAFVISHFYFALCGVRMPYYFIANSIILLIYLSIFYRLINLKDI